SAGMIVLNQWNHIAIQRAGQSLQMLVNGVRVSDVPTAAELAAADSVGAWSLSSNFDIGMRPGGASGTGRPNLNGYIDAVRLTKNVARYGNIEVP
ncbi:hypothetical protein H4F44_26090, partial [Escherichia coli]|nr:hypothetical protein [Escherichia coli]